MKNVRAILFDIDGTILDTREFILQAFEHALGTLQFEVPNRKIISKQVGNHIDDCYFALTGTREHNPKLRELHKNFQEKNYHLSRIFPGVKQILRTLREKGYQIAAVTTRFKKSAAATLQDAGVLDMFDTVIYGDTLSAVKPDPAPLLKALEILDVAPERAVMIGDSHLDILAGKNTGTKTIRVTYGFHLERMHDPKPDYFIDDIQELLKIL